MAKGQICLLKFEACWKPWAIHEWIIVTGMLNDFLQEQDSVSVGQQNYSCSWAVNMKLLRTM